MTHPVDSSDEHEEEFKFILPAELDEFYLEKHSGRPSSWMYIEDEDLCNNLYMLGWLINYGD